jgi:predicted TIM-barrel fold metal-dependent hydrolase
MEDFEIIDCHIHVARTQEEELEWWYQPGRGRLQTYATPERVTAFMDYHHVSMMAFMVITPRQLRGPVNEKARLVELSMERCSQKVVDIKLKIAETIRELNQWGCEVGEQYPRLIPFILISDDLGNAEQIEEEVVLRVSKGAKGVKLHPGMYSFYPNDKLFWPMYEKCQELGLPVLSDSGPWPHSHVLTEYPMPMHQSPKSSDHAEPYNFIEVLDAFPRLKLILAHLGSAWWDERVELAAKYPNVYFDTSQGFAASDRIPFVPHRSLAEEDAVRIMRRIGLQRIMFGSDHPALSFGPQLAQILRLDLTEQEKKMVLGGNARNIVGIQ